MGTEQRIKKIKHIMGNIDAVSSAYSLYDYQIAYDLGGDNAYNNLNERARARGIRLASDMVPNHSGIFSKWVIEHPEYFIQSSQPPFPNYSYNGPDLSDDASVQLRIEDGYWQREMRQLYSSGLIIEAEKLDTFITVTTALTCHGMILLSST